jgi:hypothetical protein
VGRLDAAPDHCVVLEPVASPLEEAVPELGSSGPAVVAPLEPVASPPAVPLSEPEPVAVPEPDAVPDPDAVPESDPAVAPSGASLHASTWASSGVSTSWQQPSIRHS